MIPLRDNIPSRTVPVVGYALIAACSAVFLLQLTNPDLTEQLAMIPARLADPGQVVLVPDIEVVQTPFGLRQRMIEREVLPALLPDWLTPLTCTFLHGGWLHLLGNMLFLWIFGDNVEDRFGHAGFAGFYLLGGLAASLAHLASNQGSPLPTVGASGAIAAVMGAYFVLYPHARVLTLIPFPLFYVFVLPAPIMLGYWFLIQLLQGSFELGVRGSGHAGGVAWWAHAGGFAFGAAAAFVLKRTRLRPPVAQVRPGTERTALYRLPPRRRPPPW